MTSQSKGTGCERCLAKPILLSFTDLEINSCALPFAPQPSPKCHIKVHPITRKDQRPHPLTTSPPKPTDFQNGRRIPRYRVSLKNTRMGRKQAKQRKLSQRKKNHKHPKDPCPSHVKRSLRVYFQFNYPCKTHVFLPKGKRKSSISRR